MQQLVRLLGAGAVLLFGISTTAGQDPLPASAESESSLRHFREQIEPVLRTRCYSCHSAAAPRLQGGLRLDSRPGILRGGDSGTAIVPGDPAASLLIQALRHENGMAMPPDAEPLPEPVVADFVRWVKSGAADPRTSEPPLAAREDPRRHWAFQPVRKPQPPSVSGETWIRNPIDAFILAELERQGWAPAEPATRLEWLRRVTFDLTGLPPTTDDVRNFLQDDSSLAFETVVERLLNSPHYGERQAQHWLDVIRFAETEGYEYDGHLPDAWRFRDYVVNAFQEDKSFRQMTREQIAGDELSSAGDTGRIASIFHRLGPVRRNAGNPDIALSRNEVLTERTDIIATAFLGLSLGCARCHDHKLEPFEQRDYYHLQAYLAATEEHNIRLAPAEQVESWNAATARIRQQQTQLREAAKAATGAERRRLEERAAELDSQYPPQLPTIPGVRNDLATRTAIHVLKRGAWEDKGEPVGPRPPAVLVSQELPELPADIPDPRTRLADWLVADDNPLTARVIVNRIWQQHFGYGIVRTANDFGTHGERPDHPQLLDWLTSRFCEDEWRFRALHRLIVLSSTYRQSGRSEWASVAARKDPGNRLLWHFPRRRLSAEELRDAMLLVSGRLNARVGGPSVMPPVDPSLVKLLYKPSQWQVPADHREHDRRSIYLMAKRNLRLPFLETFDAPALLTSCARRESSTHAPQALELLNGTLSNDLASALAARLRSDSGGDRSLLAKLAFLRVIGRDPTEKELSLSLAFLEQQPVEEFALALFNLNEFLYVP